MSDARIASSARRVAGTEVADGADVRLSPGGPAELVNISETGALVQTKAKLAVGTNVTLLIGGARPQRLAGSIVRSQVSAIHRDSTMTYLLGVAFSESSKPDGLPAPPAPAAENAPASLVAAEAAPPEMKHAPPQAPALVNEW